MAGEKVKLHRVALGCLSTPPRCRALNDHHPKCIAIEMFSNDRRIVPEDISLSVFPRLCIQYSERVPLVARMITIPNLLAIY